MTTTDTSRDAFAAVRPHLNSLQEFVLHSIKRAGPRGATPFDVIRDTGLLDYTARPRVSELKKAGLIIDSGRRRPNVRGRNEVVFVASGVAQ